MLRIKPLMIKPEPRRLPRYLHLGFYTAHQGVPFTQSSNLLYALDAALQRLEPAVRFDQILELSAWLKQELRTAGHSIIPSEAPSSPAIITIALPRSISSEQLGMDLEE